MSDGMRSDQDDERGKEPAPRVHWAYGPLYYAFCDADLRERTDTNTEKVTCEACHRKVFEWADKARALTAQPLVELADLAHEAWPAFRESRTQRDLTDNQA